MRRDFPTWQKRGNLQAKAGTGEFKRDLVTGFTGGMAVEESAVDGVGGFFPLGDVSRGDVREVGTSWVPAVEEAVGKREQS